MSAKLNPNENQQKAINHKMGPLLVVAGAGTGKTRVITERIQNLIQKQKCDPQSILALTFTEKASGEMMDRVDQVMPLGYAEPWIFTFHAFADHILKKEGLEIGLNTGYKILSGPEQWLFIRKHLFDFNLQYFRPLGNPTKFIGAILKFISRLQDEYITPEDLAKFVAEFDGDSDEKTRWKELSGFYTKYQELKIAKSKLDFGDLIVWNLKLFDERPNILKKYQLLFKHILVDEFQDTNYAQYLLVKRLFPAETADKPTPEDTTARNERSLLVVGDDSQSIYKFRGAAVSNIIEFRQDYPTAEMITLTQNYRSGQKILDSSYKLIQNNNPDTLESKLGISKKLESQSSDQNNNPRIIQLNTLEDEVTFVVNEIKDLVSKDHSIEYKDIAILARANNHLDPFILGLRRAGIPYQIVGNRGLYDRDEIRDVISLLKFLTNVMDSISLYRVLNIESLGINSALISRLLSTAKYNKMSLYEVLEKNTDASIINLVKIITKFQQVLVKETPTNFIHKLIKEIKLMETYVRDESIENDLCIKNLDKFLGQVKNFEVSYHQDMGETPNVVDYIEQLELLLEAGDNPAQAEIEDIDTINLMTVHASKGLEFPVVFLVNLVSDRFPTRDRSDAIEIPETLIKEVLPEGDPHIQEERRLFYVGMTRAKQHLYMTFGKNYGGKRDKKPSGFLDETELKTESILNEKEAEKTSQEGLFGIASGYRTGSKTDSYDPQFLSYTQFDNYLTCPQKYKFGYIQKIPTLPSHALSYGITIHDTLRDFHTKKKIEGFASLEDIHEMYKRNWQPLGYDSPQHREERFASGLKLLADYYEREKTSTVVPLHLEDNFRLKIGGIPFLGKVDRIDPINSTVKFGTDGKPVAGTEVEIIDYKTGKAKNQNDIDKDAQVAFYAMAAQEIFNYIPSKLSYFFVEDGTKFSTTRTQSDLDEKREEVLDVIARMRAGNFDATPGMHCDWCDYKDICPKRFKS